MAAEEGLSRYADQLLFLASTETDPTVQAALRDVVLKNLWEPAVDPAMIRLRLWVHGGGTEPPDDGWAELLVEPGPAAASGRDPGDAGLASAIDLRNPEPAPTAGEPPDDDPDDAEKVTVLVTGVGGPAGVAVVQALQRAGHRVIAADANENSAGLHLGDDLAVVPLASSPHFLASICTTGQEKGAQVLISTVAEEIVVLAAAPFHLHRYGLTAWLPKPEAVAKCIDKWELHRVAIRKGLPFPPTALGGARDVPGPWIVKPRRGRGSRDTYVALDESELRWALPRVPDPIVQTLLRGREFTVDVLMDRDRRLVGAVPRWRLETKAGISTKGETFVDPDLVAQVGIVGAAVGLDGPFNLQGFRDEAGGVAFTDLNPRFSGGLPLSLAAGADLVGEYMRGILGRSIRPERLHYRPGVQMSRFYREVFEG